jgi:hypothetical protein
MMISFAVSKLDCYLLNRALLLATSRCVCSADVCTLYRALCNSKLYFSVSGKYFAAVRAGPHQAGGRIAAFNACGLAWRARP